MTAKLRESTLYRGGYLAVSLAVLFLDQWTKGIITRTMDVHQSRTIIANGLVSRCFRSRRRLTALGEVASQAR